MLDKIKLSREGVAEEQLVGMNKGGTFYYEDIRATMVKAEHSGDINFNGQVFPGGEAAGFIIRFEDDFCLYHTGDTCLFPGIEELITKRYQPDVLLLPIGDLSTMGPEEAAIFVDKVKPKNIIPMHWGTFPALTGTPQALQENVAEAYKNKIAFLQPGDIVS